MKLLICTQAVDKKDPNLGFFHRWIEEFAGQCRQVTVICLREGEHTLPANVRVYALGGGGTLARAVKFLRLSGRLRKEYDSVFVHMNPEYLIAAGWLWRLLGKKTALWYAHGSVNFKLRVASVLVHTILTSSLSGFRLQSKKVRIVGQGIDIKQFVCPTRVRGAELRILTAGRISKTKNIHLMLDAADTLRVRGVPFLLTVAGAPVTPEDVSYTESLYARAAPGILFAGPKTQREIATLLCEADVFLNLSGTGSMDKAVLEALAAGVPAVSSNGAFKSLLAPYGLFVDNDRQAIAEALMRAKEADIARLTADVRTNHSLAKLIPAILKELV